MSLQSFSPMLFSEAKEVPTEPNIIAEPKWDGYRCIGAVALNEDGTQEKVVLTSREGNRLTNQFPHLIPELFTAFAGHSVVVDGELVAIDPATGRESLVELQRRKAKATYVIFDILQIDEEILVKQPLRERKVRLGEVLRETPHVRKNDVFEGDDRQRLVDAIKELGLEGVVFKNLDSRYSSGKRTKAWQKYKPGPNRKFGR